MHNIQYQLNVYSNYKVTCAKSYVVALDFYYFFVYVFLVFLSSLEDATIILALLQSSMVSGIASLTYS